MWRGGTAGEAELLASCHLRAIELAAAHGARTIAFPAISTGIFGYPLAAAAEVSLAATAGALAAYPTVAQARFWLFDERALEVFTAALARRG